MQGARARSWTSTIAAAVMATGLIGLGGAMISGRVVGGQGFGIVLTAAGIAGLASLRTQRTVRIFASLVALAAFLALVTGWQVVEGSDLALVVESSVETLFLLFGLFAALAPACLGEDVGSGNDLPRVRLCIHGHRFCPFHPTARVEPAALPVAPAAGTAAAETPA